MITRRLVESVDDRVGGTTFTRKALDKVFPDHWSFMIGEVALYCLLVLIATGMYLTFFFHPSSHRCRLHRRRTCRCSGQHMTEAYGSVVHLGFDVRAGLLIRQTHHWAALVFLGAIVLHLVPHLLHRRLPPAAGDQLVRSASVLLLLAIAQRVHRVLAARRPAVGHRAAGHVVGAAVGAGRRSPWLAFLVFGGEYPGDDILSAACSSSTCSSCRR